MREIVLSAKSAKSYFLGLQSKIGIDAMQMSKVDTNEATDGIRQQISEGELQVNRYKDDLSGIKENNGMRKKAQSVPHIQYFISEISQQDVLKAKEMMRRQEEIERMKQNEVKALEQELKNEEERKKMQKQKMRKMMFEARKPIIEESIESIKKRSQERKKEIAEQNKNFQAILREKRLHQKLLQKWQHEKGDRQREKAEKFDMLKQTKMVDFKQIRKFSIQHDQALRTMNQLREESRSESRIEFDTPDFYESVFFSRVVEDEEMMKSKIFEKKLLAKQFAEKRNEYAEIVRTNYKPRITEKSRLKEIPEQIHRSLSHAQIHNRGNDYMRQVRQTLISKQKSRTKQYFRDDKTERKPFQYKNYLTELRQKKDQGKDFKKPAQTKKYQSEVQKILSKSQLSKEEKFLRAKLATKKMENGGEIKNPYKLIDSINAKIEILKHVA